MQYQGLLGVATVIAICVVMSDNRRRIDWRLVIWGMALQVTFAALIILTRPGQNLFATADAAINGLLQFSKAGSDLLLRSFMLPPSGTGLVRGARRCAGGPRRARRRCAVPA